MTDVLNHERQSKTRGGVSLSEGAACGNKAAAVRRPWPVSPSHRRHQSPTVQCFYMDTEDDVLRLATSFHPQEIVCVVLNNFINSQYLFFLISVREGTKCEM